MSLKLWFGRAEAKAAIPEPEPPPPPAPSTPEPVDCLAQWEPSESEILRLVDKLAFVRPLVPYPGWYFDIEFANPDLAFRMRRKIWSYCQTRQIEIPVKWKWHYGIDLILQLGNDQSRQLFIGGCTEPNEFAFFDRILKPGSVFIDAGANDGLYSLLAARRIGGQGVIWAFEPSQREFSRLTHHIELNGLTSIRAFQTALSDFEGSAELSVAAHEHAGLNTLGEFIHPGVALLRKETVDVRTLDGLVRQESLPRVDVMKLDVEGEEARLIEGARGVMETMRPIVLFELAEFSPGNKGDQLLGLLRALKYEIYCFSADTGWPVPMGSAPEGTNLVAAPQETPLPNHML